MPEDGGVQYLKKAESKSMTQIITYSQAGVDKGQTNTPRPTKTQKYNNQELFLKKSTSAKIQSIKRVIKF